MQFFRLRNGRYPFVFLSFLLSIVFFAPMIEPTATAAQTNSSDVNFPADFTTIINVKTRYGAAGDGRTDDTAALQRAISENVGTNRVLYLPNGVYLVSNRLEWRRNDAARPWSAFLTLMGQNRNSTVIRLRENASGYSDTNNPRGVIFTASDDFTPRDQPPRPGYLETGIGNEAFGNYIENLTIDTGNNRGAIGIDYLASNTGAIRNVSVRGQGVAGVALIRALQGPELIKNISVEGFDYGVLIRDAIYAATFENISVANQRVAGISNQGQLALSIRNLNSFNQVPALQNLDSLSLVDLIDANLNGGAGNRNAIENAGQMLARNISGSGYQSAIKNGGNIINGNYVSEWISRQPFSLFASPAKTLNLPVEDAPEFHDNDFNNWANVAKFGAVADDWNDDTSQIQVALNSGKSTVYLPHGFYLIGQTLRVPPTVKRIIGGDLGIGWGAFADANNPQPLLKIEGAAGEPLIIEKLSVSRKHNGSPLHRGLIIVEHHSPRTLVLKDITTLTDRIFGAYRSTASAGKLFIEDVAASQFFFDHPQKVWVRQLNPENPDELRIRNRAADLWILGIKTEGYGSIIETGANASTELLGGNLYSTTSPIYPLPPAFINNNGRVSLSYTTTAYAPWTADFPVHVMETRDYATKNFLFGDAVWRGDGRIVPLYTGYKNAGTIAEGVYEIEPWNAPGMRLNVAGNSDANGADVDIFRDVNSAGERWRITPVGDGFYELAPLAAPTRRLDVWAFGFTSGADIRLWQSTGAANQRWKIVSVGDNLYEFVPQHTAEQRMDVNAWGNSDGANVQIWATTQGANQRWRLYQQ